MKRLCAPIPILLLACGSSMATTAAAETAVEPDDEEVVVTARKIRETVTDTPVAVTALTGQALERADVTDLRSLAAVSPGLYLESQGAARNDRSQNSVVIRGMPVGSTLNLSAERASVFIDGAPILGGFIEGVTDVARVEVIRGPQSAYFGRSTFAGAINVVTRDPGDAVRVSARASYASYGTTDNQLSIEGPIVREKLSARLTGRYMSTDGQYANPAVADGRLGARSTRSLALTVLGTPTDTLRVKLYGILWRDKDGTDARGKIYNADFNCNAGAGVNGARNWICGELPIIAASRLGQNELLDQTVISQVINAGRNGGPLRPAIPSNFNQSYGLERRAHHLHGIITWETPVAGTSVAYTGAVDRNDVIVINDSDSEDTRYLPLAQTNPLIPPYFNYAVRADFAVRSSYHELRLASAPRQRLRWLLGGTVFDGSRLSATPGQTPFGLAQFGFIDSRVNTKAVFGSATYDITDRLNLSVEGRYQWDKVRQQTSAGTPPVPGPQLSASFGRFLPRVIVAFKPQADFNIYASFARGSNPGGVNSSVFAQPPAIQQQIIAQTGVRPVVDEELLDNYEIGFKGRLMDGDLRFATALYYGKWRNQQVNAQAFFTLPNGAVNSVSAVANIGRTDIYGFEIEIDARLSDRLRASGSLAINENELKVYDCVPCRTAITGIADVAGNKLARAPRANGFASLDWEDALTGDWRYFGRAEYSYTGRTFVTEANVAWIGAKNRVNLRAGVTNDRFRLEGFVTNLFNELDYVSAERGIDFVRGGNAILVGLPIKRTVGVRAGVEF